MEMERLQGHSNVQQMEKVDRFETFGSDTLFICEAPQQIAHMEIVLDTDWTETGWISRQSCFISENHQRS